MSQPFSPALPQPIKWSVGNNPFKDDDRPSQLSLQIPVESIPSFCEHLMGLEEQEWCHRIGNVYDYQSRQIVPRKVVYLRASGRVGNYGKINPRKLSGENPSHTEQR